MALRDPIGVRFSELKDNHEKDTTSFWRTFDRYGDLPNGGCYGVAELSAWFDPWQLESQYAVLGADGELTGCTDMHSPAGQWFSLPDALVATPTGDALVCLEYGKLWLWMREEDGWGFGNRSDLLYIPNDAAVIDACMNADGTLDVWCADGAHYVFVCRDGLLLLPDDAGLFLCLLPDGAAGVHGGMAYSWWDVDKAVPGIHGLIIGEDVDNWFVDLSEYRELRFLEGVTRIAEAAYYGMRELRRVVIPASVTTVDRDAFAECPQLTDLAIKGDLARVASWSEYAFAGCPCEEEYLKLRRS